MSQGTIRRWKDAIGGSRVYARRHRSTFWRGAVAALCVVAFRIALPWPLEGLLDPIVAGGQGMTGTTTSDAPPADLRNVLMLGGLFFGLLIGLGLVDHRERLAFARFAIGMVHDLRTTAAQAAARLGQNADPTFDDGDLIARLIGDTARVKTGLKGFLVHVATNGAMFIGVTIVLLWVDLKLGLVFALAGVAIAAVTVMGAAAIFRRASRYRDREGQLASAIHASRADASDITAFADLGESSASHEAAITQLQGRTTWAAHSLFGLAVFICLVLGVRGAQAGEIDPGHIVVFVMYALMMRAPMVQLARQGARTGKIVACLERVVHVIRESEELNAADVALPPLQKGLTFDGVRTRGGLGTRGLKLMGQPPFVIHPGERIQVLGPTASGKSRLLELIAGVQAPKVGTVWWDSLDLAGFSPAERAMRVGYVSNDPRWPRRVLRDLLCPPGCYVSDETMMETLKACLASSLVRRLPDGLDTKIASTQVSPGYRKRIALARMLLDDRLSMLLLDDPGAGHDALIARKLIRATLARSGPRVVIISSSRPMRVSRFDRIVELKRGRIRFDGDPKSWRQQQAHTRKDPADSAVIA